MFICIWLKARKKIVVEDGGTLKCYDITEENWIKKIHIWFDKSSVHRRDWRCPSLELCITNLNNMSLVMIKCVFGSLRPGKTQTDLLSYRDQLESWNFGYTN